LPDPAPKAAGAPRPRGRKSAKTGKGDPQRRRWRRRAIAIGSLVAVVAGVTSAIVAATWATPATAAAPIPLGIVGAGGGYFAQEQAAGLKSVMILVSWSNAEPLPGRYDDAYLSSVGAQITQARSRSLGVVLDPGLQYPPSWVFALPGGTRFVDQYGDIHLGAARSGSDVANAVTDPAVRTAEARYLRALSVRIPGTLLAAVRTGGGPEDQLSYPTSTYHGHQHCFWAYDSSSQSQSPVPGWKPGTGTTADAATFLTAYNNNLIAYGAWLDIQMAADFGTTQLIMLPGWGERPGVATQEILTRLTLGYAEFSQGLDWADLLPSLPNPTQIVAYSTYLDAPTLERTAQLENPMSYIAGLAQPLQMRIGGENTGQGTVLTLDHVVKRALSLHLSFVDWMDETQVIASAQGRDPGGPTFAGLAKAAMSLGQH
jgi:hypothetical protein